MIRELRLVLEVERSSYGDVPLETRYYFLQQRILNVRGDGQWSEWDTLPIVLHSDLSPEEQKEIEETFR